MRRNVKASIQHLVVFWISDLFLIYNKNYKKSDSYNDLFTALLCGVMSLVGFHSFPTSLSANPQDKYGKVHPSCMRQNQGETNKPVTFFTDIKHQIDMYNNIFLYTLYLSHKQPVLQSRRLIIHHVRPIDDNFLFPNKAVTFSTNIKHQVYQVYCCYRRTILVTPYI